MSEKLLTATNSFAVPASPAREGHARVRVPRIGRASGVVMLVALLVAWEVASRAGLVSPATEIVTGILFPVGALDGTVPVI